MASPHAMTKTLAAVTITVIIGVAVSDVMIHQKFQKKTDLTHLRDENAQDIPNMPSKIQCAGYCDRENLCNGFSWNQNTKMCRAFTTRVTHAASTSHRLSNVFTSNKDVCTGNGYSNTAGMCIKFFPYEQSFTWNGAVSFCISEGGRLVVADTMEKFHYIQDQISNNPAVNAQMMWLIGASKRPDRIWKWTTGQALSSSIEIYEDKPDDSNCLGFNQHVLEDFECYVLGKAICEK